MRPVAVSVPELSLSDVPSVSADAAQRERAAAGKRQLAARRVFADRARDRQVRDRVGERVVAGDA